MSKLIMMRHGESEWNRQNLFTGWVDIPLSPKGIKEALDGGELIKDIPIDIIFTSSLIRASMTAMLAMTLHRSKKIPVMLHPGEGKLEQWSKNSGAPDMTIPVYSAWQLNERMYGDLQGLNKQAMRDKYGDEQVKIWRRSFDVAPPNGESLAMTAERTLPYFNEVIVPYLVEGKNVFISAHGNSLRSIIMELDRLSKEEVINLEIATGIPIIYEYKEEKFIKCPSLA